VDSILIMITLAFDRYDFKRKTQYPNGWNVELYKYADTLDVNDCFQIVRNKFILASNHSELRGNVLNRLAGKYVILDKLDIKNYDGETLFYPIEIYGSHNHFNEPKIYKTDDDIEYNINFINVISTESIELAKLNKLYFVFNISHEPFSDLNFLKEFSKQIKSIGLKESNFIFFVGTSNLLELYPQIKEMDFIFYFENNLLISSCKKVEDLKICPNHKLGYKTEWLKSSDILNKRKKYFVCPNRNSNKPHRHTLGCFFEAENLWDKLYCSFLQKYNTKTKFIDGLSKELINKFAQALPNFAMKVPIEMDTENLKKDEKESFEVTRAFKKEIYTDSYIHIVTETNFSNDIFPTEKIINPMIVLQPFILFGAPGYLKYIKELGFKTFNGFIDESYDNEYNDGKRFEMICDEIKRLSELSLEEIHNWYISIIIPILEYNRNYALKFAKKSMFLENLEKYK
jgi:hypothetical protein